jgi:hypothetical protein
MTHLPFIAASYALGIGVPLVYGITAYLRTQRARARLNAIDPRAARRDAAA